MDKVLQGYTSAVKFLGLSPETADASLESDCGRPFITKGQFGMVQITMDDLLAKIPKILKVATAQYRLLLQRIRNRKGQPRTAENGFPKMVGPRDWTSGFFPGSLWYLYEHTGDAIWMTTARKYTERLHSSKDYDGTHDLGFILNCSYGNGYRLTKDAAYKDVLIQGARTLATRFNRRIGVIRSWDHSRWNYPVIIDNMMNLELLTWAAQETGETCLREIAVQHADNTLRNHFRADASSYHVLDYDVTNGEILQKQTYQGISDSSAWARGQAWGLYGYTMMFGETGNTSYLNQAKRIASFIIGHPRLPSDKIPYWDFDAPNIPYEQRDASAGAITSSALIELSSFVDTQCARSYLEIAQQQLLSLSSDSYLANLGANGGFLLKHAVGNHPKNSEVDVPLNYADYYFLEALLRYRYHHPR